MVSCSRTKWLLLPRRNASATGDDIQCGNRSAVGEFFTDSHDHDGRRESFELHDGPDYHGADHDDACRASTARGGPARIRHRNRRNEHRRRRANQGFYGRLGQGVGNGSRHAVAGVRITAYIGQYSGGNWDSTVRISAGNKIETGSLPNLLYLMSAWSKDKIKTNYTNVQAIKLDSDEIFSVKPPFIFLTGTRDFKLTDKEVENLQKYVRMGGCIWGDSSLPGLRSRFDIAFRREMKRVIPDVDKNFEPCRPIIRSLRRAILPM